MEQSLTSVSDVVNAIKTTLEFEYSDLLLEGEVSNLSLSSAGHYYFSLSDSKASLSCALFKMDALRNPFIRRIKNGDKVIIRGPISVYAKRGTFQVIVKKITPHGKGDLKAQFEILKERLSKDGLFDISLKKTVPTMPKKIAVITALRGAALQDFLNVLKRRCLWFDILIVPSIVQGDQCAPSIISAIEKIENLAEEIEVIVLTRGGGSMEDLWGFNDEALIRKVARCEIPVISAIGHQVDYTLIDYVSDLRCETPSTAAEFLSQEQTKLNQRLKISIQRISILFHSFKNILQKRLSRVNPIRLSGVLQNRISQNYKKLERLNLIKRESLLRMKDNEFLLDELITKLQDFTFNKLNQNTQKLNMHEKALFNLNPKQVLSRGYTYVSYQDKVLSSIKDVKKITSHEKVKITFHDGEEIFIKE